MQPTRIHANKTPIRRHFIPEWAAARKLKKADIARELDANKGLVTRWFKGTLPGPDYLDRLAALLHADSADSLFRHPDEDWIAKFFKDRSEDERARAREMLSIAFPTTKRTGT